MKGDSGRLSQWQTRGALGFWLTAHLMTKTMHIFCFSSVVAARERVLARKDHEIIVEKQVFKLRLSSAPVSRSWTHIVSAPWLLVARCETGAMSWQGRPASASNVELWWFQEKGVLCYRCNFFILVLIRFKTLRGFNMFGTTALVSVLTPRRKTKIVTASAQHTSSFSCKSGNTSSWWPGWVRRGSEHCVKHLHWVQL